MKNTLKMLAAALSLSCVLIPAAAQKAKTQRTTVAKPAGKPLHHAVYDFWEEIPEQAISDDGKFTAFAINPQQGDGHLYVYTKATNAPIAKISRGGEIKFTSDSRYLIFKIKPEFDKVQGAKRAKKKKEDMPKDSLAVLSLTTGEITKWPAVKSYKIPEKGSGWVAFLKEEPTVPMTADSTQKKAGKPKKESEENGYTLIVKELPGTAESGYPFVKEYTFSKGGTRLAFTSTGQEPGAPAGIFIMRNPTSLPFVIYKGHPKQAFTKLSFDETGEQLAFIADLDTNAKTQIRYPKLGYWKAGDREASVKIDESNQPGGANWLVNGDYTPNFSKNGQTLFYGINPAPVVPDTTLLPEEIVNVEVWHWQDPKLQTQQKVSFQTDKKRSFLSALHINDNQSVQLATEPLQAVALVNEGNAPFALLNDPSRYSHEHWDWNPKSDVYLVNIANGQKKLIKEKMQGRAAASPLGKFLYWFSNPDTAWVAYSVEKATIVPLTDNRDVKFANEEDDHPDFPNSYGVAGWTENDQHILLYDRFDIWLVDPANPATKTRLTRGRENQQRYRYVRLDPEERHIDLSKPLLLRSFNEQSKQEGLYSFTLSDKALTQKLIGDFRIGVAIRKARASDEMLFTKETFRDFPNWHQTDLSFTSVKQITRANSQQNEYAWGTVELVTWNAADGTPLSGLLYKPDNFDPTRQYPMMTYFYERNSDNLHTHFAPKPIRSYLNFSYFTSNGYLVFVPDIVYQTGYPGQSAYNCVIPGVLSQVEKGFVDKSRLGISGHSWGGYQTAYIVTRTDLFRAAEAGAPVSNMTSAYGGIRWDTGLVRQAQYEKTQSRIGGTLWEKPLQFLENSPLFFADKVNTPLLMMHNDEDGAVPWYQGIEYYLALKRLGKPVWMLNYTGEKHGLAKRQNMTDFAVRLYQFFDHYLKDAPAPKWLVNGLPYLEKGINQGLELTD